MPTSKKRVGFIPRVIVLEIINKLSFENNLSYSKIINILVEEALIQRGILNINGEVVDHNYDNVNKKSNKSILKNNQLKNTNNINSIFIEDSEKCKVDFRQDCLDSEIYEKFLMFLQFQEKMKKNNIL